METGLKPFASIYLSVWLLQVTSPGKIIGFNVVEWLLVAERFTGEVSCVC